MSSKGSNALEERIIYHDYDNFGNPIDVSKADGTRISYIYGYNNSLPVAQLVGVPYKDISPTLINSIHLSSNTENDTCYGIDRSVCSEAGLRKFLKDLRDTFPEAQTTTYTYNPLIGVTSVTDPRGQTSYYEYDIFNRLKAVKDSEGNLLEETTYNYKN